MIRKIQLTLQTGSLIASFMCWVLISSLMTYIQTDIPLTPNQSTWATAIPVILGSILRIPVGFLTNRLGARMLFVISFVALLVPIWYLSISDSFLDLMISGFFLGIGGATFSIGVTSLPKYYPEEKHGTINGIYGVGNMGTAFTTFGAPILANTMGWRAAIYCYLVLVAVFAILNFWLGDKQETKVNKSIKEQFSKVSHNEKLWFLSLFYFITFGSFVAFTVYLPNFFVNQFDLDKVDAGLRTAGFIVLATLLRPVGGILSDKLNPFMVLMFVFGGLTLSGILLSFNLSMVLFTIGCLAVAVFSGIGNGAVFKLVPQYFSKQSGIVNGIVAAAGGLGGFFPPLMLTSLYGLTGHYSIGFMALSEAALASLVIVFWMFFQAKIQLSNDIIESTADAVMVTNDKSIIISVNHAFTQITGYSQAEVLGKTANILSSGQHDHTFYESFWKQLLEKGHWQGEIINKHADGHLFQEWLTVSVIKDDQDMVKNYVAIFSDISKKKE
ncbi:nitrate/nitrite transporter [Paenibacillus crassostreae]|uniref:Nitrate/nitrite transporter n=1 Tax=Paenibacillus crassostreae TaxID=1763538 RepID=A0A162KW12_9BACL|nr:NarK/NasA family nitrate transporter [Paenibacillus crassostreae]AOZ90973.1 nitrate/nitrite transporter [Paenibacillus crassostreae]OAB74863.1 nitrate/nitrite transporter [Paenibacillus crassostreae]